MKNITEGKLIKTEFGFKLNDLDGVYVASVQTGSLSLENCEAIERGYDLDELAKDRFGNSSHHTNNRCSYKEGFQKALEILGDKKFSEDDMRIAYNDGMDNIGSDGDYIDRPDEDFNDTIKSLQQTEWDVIIETTCDGLVTGLCMPEVCDCNIIPKRDSKGRIILKIKK